MSVVRIGKRKTRQKTIIYDLIMYSERPLSIANLVALARERKAKIGQATVYRTVNALLEADEIQQVQIPGGEALYEKSDIHHHHHFKCNKCGKVYDLPGCLGTDLEKFLPPGFLLVNHDFTFYGLCAECS